MLTVLIGPPAAGKSSIGFWLADLLGCEFVDADAAGEPFYAEVGWSVERLRRLSAERGYELAHRAWEPALTHAVERLVELHPDAVIALGAGPSHPPQPHLFERIQNALAGAGRVVLLRPASDVDACVRILRDRCIQAKGHDWTRDGIDWLRRWCTDGRDEQLATDTVLTIDETSQATANRLANR